MTTQQQNDRIAYSGFLRSSATPLIDLSMFVSAENYNTTTSSAYTAILPWYANYTVPPKRRELARTRTAHMGLDSLDVDTRTEAMSGPGRGTASAEFEAAKRAAGLPTDSKPSFMSIGRGKGFGGLLGTPKLSGKFRLDAVSSELLEPLSDLLGDSEYLLGTSQPSSLDCLAYGYLSLMLFPAVPQAWLRETITGKFPRLATYIQRLRKDVYADHETNAARVWAITTSRASSTEQSESTHLPWSARSQNFTTNTFVGIKEVIGSIPVISSLMKRELPVEPTSTSSRVRSELYSPVFVNTLLGLTAAVAVGFASFAIQHRRSPREGELVFWALRPSVGLGDAGNIFNVLGQVPRGAFSQF